MERQEYTCSLQQKGCGGCPLLSLPYEEQLRKKQKAMKKLMGNLGKVRPVIGMENPWHYRNKAISTFTEGPGRQLISGIYARGSHYVIPVKTCLLHHPALDEAVRAVRKAARLCKYKPYDEDRKTGLIRHVLVRHSLLTDEVLVVLITASGCKGLCQKGTGTLPERHDHCPEYQCKIHQCSSWIFREDSVWKRVYCR